MAKKVFNKTILQTSFTSLESIYYLLQTVKDNQPMSSADGKDSIFPQARAKISQARGGEWSEDKRDTHAELTLAEMRFIRYTDETKNTFEVSDMGNEFLSSFNLIMNANDEGKYNLVLEDKLCLQDKNQFLFDILTGIKVDQPKYGRKIRPYLILFKLLVDNSLKGYISKSEWAYFINNSSFVSDYQYEEIKSAALYVRQNNAVVEPQKSDRILTRLVSWKVLDRYVIGKDNSNYFTINPDFLETIKNNFYMTGNITDTSKVPASNPQKGYMQKIFYGAPGTGKSNGIKELTGEGKDGFVFSKDFTFRTTFHPDFDYSSFVGAYKPIWDKEKEKIVYEFRPQTFLKAYVAAWTHPSENVALVIEEINRGNCAQIFGDIFQLLDRENNGMSKYPIESDVDMKDFLSSALSGEIEEPWAGTIHEDDKDGINEYYSKHYDDAFAKIKSGEILTLPKNLSVLATMNTSDQSLFPMDSAFKRRWEWQYMPIVDGGKNWKIQLSNDYENIDWWDFLERINKVIADLTTSEDKQLGYFFCQPDDFVSPEHTPDAEPDLISAKRFVDKVIFYLWNDVFKDYAFDAKCCKDNDSKEVLFAKFYNKDGKSVNVEILKQFFMQLEDDKKPSLVAAKPTADTSETEKESTATSSADEAPGATDDVSEESESSTTDE